MILKTEVRAETVLSAARSNYEVNEAVSKHSPVGRWKVHNMCIQAGHVTVGSMLIYSVLKHCFKTSSWTQLRLLAARLI